MTGHVNTFVTGHSTNFGFNLSSILITDQHELVGPPVVVGAEVTFAYNVLPTYKDLPSRQLDQHQMLPHLLWESSIMATVVVAAPPHVEPSAKTCVAVITAPQASSKETL